MTMHQRWKDDEDAGMAPFQPVTPVNPERARKYEEAFKMYDLTGDEKYLDIFNPVKNEEKKDA